MAMPSALSLFSTHRTWRRRLPTLPRPRMKLRLNCVTRKIMRGVSQSVGQYPATRLEPGTQLQSRKMEEELSGVSCLVWQPAEQGE